MTKIIMLIFETCDQVFLAEVMIDYTKRFEEVLKSPFSKAKEKDDPVLFYNLVKEKYARHLI
jgi:hypothetical protein